MTDIERSGLICGDLARGFENKDVGKENGIDSEVRDGFRCKIHQDKGK